MKLIFRQEVIDDLKRDVKKMPHLKLAGTKKNGRMTHRLPEAHKVLNIANFLKRSA